MKKSLVKKIILILIILFAILPMTNVNAIMKNNNPLLIEITIEGEPIKPEFDQFITDYVIAVDREKEKIEIEAVTDDPNATAEIIGDSNLKVGVNDFEIKVTAEDGTTTNSYFLHITRGDIEKANANLKNVEIDGLKLNPSFNEKDTNYFVEYEGYKEKLDIVATAENEKAKVEIINNENISGAIHVITIKVTAEDGITSKEYTVTAKKAGEDVENLSGLEEHEAELIQAQENVDKKQIENQNIWLIAIVTLIAIIIVWALVKKGKKS